VNAEQWGDGGGKNFLTAGEVELGNTTNTYKIFYSNGTYKILYNNKFYKFFWYFHFFYVPL
jgi:hypothetical protein